MRTYRLFIALLVVATCSQVAFAAPKSNSDTHRDYKLCTTQACVNEALRISDYIDRTVDPCDNFYKFACGGWIKNNPEISSVLSILSQKTSEKLKEILEDAPKLDDTLSLEKARKLYNMCMDTEEFKKIGISALREVVQKNGGWPITMSPGEWERKGNRTWQQVSDILQNNMFGNGLYKIWVSEDVKEPDTNVITIERPDFRTPLNSLTSFEKVFVRNFVKKTIYTSYIEAMEKVADMFVEDSGTYVEKDAISQEALDVVNFEIELVELTSNYSNDIDEAYNSLTIEKLQQAYDAQRPEKSKINWLYSIQRLFASEGIKINSSEKLTAHKYLTSLVPLLERTPSRTIINYMQWHFIRPLLPYIERTEEIADQVNQFTVPFLPFPFPEFPRGTVNKTEVRTELRWKRCLQKNANLHTAISQEYAKRYVQLENKEDISDMVTDIENTVRGQITASTWMDEPVKKASLEILKSMRKKILLPNWFSNEAIDKYYDGLAVTSEYLQSAINVIKFKFKKVLGKLRKPVDKSEWDTEPTYTNAYYHRINHEIVIPAAITQSPIYDKNRPAFMNYGVLGVVVGHEINHGFINLGRKYEKNGVEWLTQETINKTKKLTQCFVDQYNSYLVPGLEQSKVHVNGQFSLVENIGDFAGVVAAYKAYKNRKARLNEPELRLQGLEDYSDDQLFFMGFTQMFCESSAPQQILPRLFQLDMHPMPETRMRGSYSNFPEFSKAYNCSAGKIMNPEKRCALW